MSDHWEGPGWWIASDGRWYPPQSSLPPPPPPPVQPQAVVVDQAPTSEPQCDNRWYHRFRQPDSGDEWFDRLQPASVATGWLTLVGGLGVIVICVGATIVWGDEEWFTEGNYSFEGLAFVVFFLGVAVVWRGARYLLRPSNRERDAG